MTAAMAESVEELLRDELTLGDVVISTAAPILRHLLANDDQSFFSDEVLARVRGMLGSIARQLLLAVADAEQISSRAEFVEQWQEPISAALIDQHVFLIHAHALTLEAQLTERLRTRSNIDPVLSPLLQALTASQDQAMASSAMTVLAAQARFLQQQRRMLLPLGELPGDLFHQALVVLRSKMEDREEQIEAAQRTLRGQFDESRSRLGLISRLVMRMGNDAPKALDLDHSGVAIFATALAMASGQERALAVLSFSDRQFARLALSLRAAGLKQDALEEQFLYLHPDIALPEGFEALQADRASALLAASSPALGA